MDDLLPRTLARAVLDGDVAAWHALHDLSSEMFSSGVPPPALPLLEAMPRPAEYRRDLLASLNGSPQARRKLRESSRSLANWGAADRFALRQLLAQIQPLAGPYWVADHLQTLWLAWDPELGKQPARAVAETRLVTPAAVAGIGREAFRLRDGVGPVTLARVTAMIEKYGLKWG